MQQSHVRTGFYRNLATVISNLLVPILMGDACKVIRATVISSTDASYLNVIQLSFSLTSLPSVTQPVDATCDYGVPVRK